MKKTQKNLGTSLAVQWLRLLAPSAGHMGSIPGQGTKIPHAAWLGQKKRIYFCQHEAGIIHRGAGQIRQLFIEYIPFLYILYNDLHIKFFYRCG